jgi:hypothetical protein
MNQTWRDFVRVWKFAGAAIAKRGKKRAHPADAAVDGSANKGSQDEMTPQCRPLAIREPRSVALDPVSGALTGRHMRRLARRLFAIAVMR